MKSSPRSWIFLVAHALILPAAGFADPDPDLALLANPERGWYAQREVQAEGEPLTYHDLVRLREVDRTTLILRLYYLKKFRDRPLSDRQLELIEKDFEAIRSAGVKAILRFAYSQAENEADAPLEFVLKHIEQLKPLLHANADVIAVVQAGFIGAWGEWHASSAGLATTPRRQAVVKALLEALPAKRMIQVRAPAYKQGVFGSLSALNAAEAYSGKPIARVGHHNDCFLASDNDAGTYRNIPADKAYLEGDTRFTPMGGETCRINPPRSGCAIALEELARFHWSFLHSGYHAGVLESWKNDGCTDEMARRLGYRLVLLNARATSPLRSDASMSVEFQIRNDGWAAPFNPRELNVILRHRMSGAEFFVTLPEDPRRWWAGKTSSVRADVFLSENLPGGSYDVLLHLADPEERLRLRPEYAIRLANQDVWEEQTGYNRLDLEVIIPPSAARTVPAGALAFRPMKRLEKQK